MGSPWPASAPAPGTRPASIVAGQRCTEHLDGAWVAQQARNLAWQLQEAEVRPRFLIHDRDANFSAGFDAVFLAEGLEVIRTPVRAPNANDLQMKYLPRKWLEIIAVKP